MNKSKKPSVKQEQKKAFLLKELSAFVCQISCDEPKVAQMFVNRVDLSKDTGICYVYFSTYSGEEAFREGLEVLKLYKPSMRKALAQSMRSRYVPDLVFRYDETKEKERKVNSLLDKISEELKNSDV